MGVWVMVFLFLGFRADWDKGIAIVSGIIIIAIAYRGGIAARTEKTPPAADTFVQNKENI